MIAFTFLVIYLRNNSLVNCIMSKRTFDDEDIDPHSNVRAGRDPLHNFLFSFLKSNRFLLNIMKRDLRSLCVLRRELVENEKTKYYASLMHFGQTETHIHHKTVGSSCTSCCVP